MVAASPEHRSLQGAPHVLEAALFGDLKATLMSVFGWDYDPRNSLVVGFIMGFAVIPIIFTICEDALSSVPRHLVSASLSCGANQWQTTWRVVLPVALSGIYSAALYRYALSHETPAGFEGVALEQAFAPKGGSQP